MRLKYIEIKKIEVNSPFFFHTSHTPAGFYESVKKSGLLTPIPVIEKKGSYLPLDGQKRLKAAIKNKLKKIPVLIYDEMSTQNAWLFAIINSGGGKNLSLSEKSKIFQHTVLKFANENFKAVFEEMGEYPGSQNIQFFETILSLPVEIHAYMDRYGLSKKQAGALIRLPEKLLINMVQLGQELAIRPVELIEMSNTFFEISRAQIITTEEINNALGMEAILKNESLNRNEKIRRIKENLRRMRFPRLTKINHKLQEMANQLPATVKARWLTSLEKATFEIILEIKNPADARGLKNIVSDEKTKLILQNISAILHGEELNQ